MLFKILPRQRSLQGPLRWLVAMLVIACSSLIDGVVATAKADSYMGITLDCGGNCSTQTPVRAFFSDNLGQRWAPDSIGGRFSLATAFPFGAPLPIAPICYDVYADDPSALNLARRVAENVCTHPVLIQPYGSLTPLWKDPVTFSSTVPFSAGRHSVSIRRLWVPWRQIDPSWDYVSTLYFDVQQHAVLTAASGTSQNAQVLQPFAQPLQVLVKDDAGQPLPNTLVTFTRQYAPPYYAMANLSSMTATTNAQGIASVSATANGYGGSYSILADAAGSSGPVTFALTNAGSPAHLQIIDGSPQSVPLLAAFPQPLRVQVTDDAGNPTSGVTVSFTPSYGPPTYSSIAIVSSQSAVTDGNGIASVTATANGYSGFHTVTASAPGVNEAPVFSLSNHGAGAQISVKSGNNQSAQLLNSFAHPLEVQVTDDVGTPASGVRVDFTTQYLPPNYSANAVLGSASATTDITGVARIAVAANGYSGAHAVVATVFGTSQSTTFSLINHGAASTFGTSSGTAQSAVVLSLYATPLTVQVTDDVGSPAGGTVVTFTAPSDGASVTLSQQTVTTGADGSATVTATANGAPGSFDVTASIPGNSSPFRFALTNLTPPPLLTGVSPATGPTTGGTTLSLTGANFADVTGVSIGGVPVTAFTVNDSTSITVTTSAGAAGPASVVVRTASGENPSNNLFSYTQAPFAAVQAVASQTLRVGSRVTPYAPVTASGGTGTLGFALSGGTLPAGLDFSPTTGEISGTPTEAMATTAFTVTITDTPGTVSTGSTVIFQASHGQALPTPRTASNTFSLTVEPSLVTVSAINPDQGSTAGGNSVTLTGSGFADATAVSIGGAPATNVVVHSDTSITATAPAGSAGAANVIVTTPAGSNTANSLYRYIVPLHATLSLSSVSIGQRSLVTPFTPVIGLGGTGALTYAITGGSLPDGLTISPSTGQISGAAIAAMTATSVTVTVSDETSPTPQTAQQSFTLTVQPQIPLVASAGPLSGPIDGGTPVTLKGSYFDNVTAISIGGVAVDSFTIVDDTTITLVTPMVDLPGSWPFVLAYAGGQSESIDKFSFLSAGVSRPRVTAISPSSGRPGGGTSVTITGMFFAGMQYVTIGGQQATGVTQVNDTTITATVPNSISVATPGGVTGSVSVQVHTAEGTNRANQLFTYAKAPQSLTFNTDLRNNPRAGDSYQPVVANSSGLPVTISIDPASATICDANAGTVTFRATGTCVINADAAGDENFETAQQVSQTHTVVQGTQSLAFINTPPNQSAVGDSFTPTATASSGLPVAITIDASSAAICDIAAGIISFRAMGDCVINADQVGDANFAAAPRAQMTITVGKSAQTLSFTTTPSGPLHVGESFLLTAAASSGLTPTLTIDAASSAVCGFDSGYLILLATGDCTVNADQPGDDSVHPAARIQKSLPVLKGTQTVIFSHGLRAPPQPGDTFDPAARSSARLEATVTVDAASAAICDITAGIVTFRAQGDCLLYADQPGNENFEPAPRVAMTIVVAAATDVAQLISFSNPGDTAFEPDLTVTLHATGGGSGNPVTFTSTTPAVCSATDNLATISSAGTCTINAAQAGNSQYAAAADVSQTFNIAKGQQEITFLSKLSKPVVVGDAISPRVRSSSELPVTLTVDAASAAVCTITAGLVDFTSPGICVLNADQPGDTNFLPAQKQFAIEVLSATGPTIALSADRTLLIPGQTALISFALSEAMTDFDADSIRVFGGTLSNFNGDGQNFSVTFTPTPGSTGPWVVWVENDAFFSDWGIGNQDAADADNSVAFTYDVSAPTISLGTDKTALNPGESAEISFTLSDDANDFDVTDVAVTGGNLSGFSGNGSDYTAIFRPAPDTGGQATISVANGAFTDASGLANADATDADNRLLIAITKDTTAPAAPVIARLIVGPDGRVTVSGTAEPGAAVEVTFPDGTFEIAMVDDFGLFSVTSANPQSGGSVSVVVRDAAGNASAPTTQPLLVDSEGPKTVISGAPDSVEHGGNFVVDITFSEPVHGFTGADIQANNARVIRLDGSAATYKALVEATGGDLSLIVPAKAANDAAGNGNLGSNKVSVRVVQTAANQRAIAGFMYSRANQLLTHQPDLTEFLSQRGHSGLSFDANLTAVGGNLNFVSDPSKPVWLRLQGSWTDEAGKSGRYVFGALGGHIALRENLLVGAMLQFDHDSEQDGRISVHGNGWLAGPYFVAKAVSHPLYIEGRLLYGQTGNAVTATGSPSSSFDTKRLLAKLKLAGELHYGKLTLNPFVDAAYTTDRQSAYVDSFGTPVSAQSIAMGQLSLGVDFAAPVAVAIGTMEINGGLSGIWTTTTGTGIASGVVPVFEGGRAKLDLGFTYARSAGSVISGQAFYDGLGAQDYRNYGLALNYQRKF